MYDKVFLIAVAVSGLTEWIKNLLPSKVKESKIALTIIAGVISVIAAIGYGIFAGLTRNQIIVYTVSVVGLVQAAYNMLFQTFKAVIEKLKAKTTTTTDTDAIADKIVDTITTNATKLLEEASEATDSDSTSTES